MLEFKKVNAFYHKKQVIFNANFNINKGVTCVLGKNGSGKTTLFSLVLNQIKYTGDIIFNNKNLKELSITKRAKMVSFLPQSLNDTALTVKELVMLARSPYLNFNSPKTEDYNAVDTAIKTVELNEKENQKVCNLSGGEKQRAYLALMLAKNTDLYIFDEPLSFLDPKFSSLFLSVVKQLKQQEKTVVIIMHDVNKALEIADEILLIDDGKIKFLGQKDEAINAKIIEKTFNLKKYEIIENNEKEVVFK